MKKLNKAIAIALSAVTVFSASSVVPITANAKVTNVVSSSATSTRSGKCGTNVKWIYKNNVLTIYGKGKMTREIPESVTFKAKELIALLKSKFNTILSFSTLAFFILDLTIFILSLLLSTKTHLLAPLDKHSIPKEPVPANKSNISLSIIYELIILNKDSFTLSVVGLTSSFLGAFNFSPLTFPEITLKIISPFSILPQI